MPLSFNIKGVEFGSPNIITTRELHCRRFPTRVIKTLTITEDYVHLHIRCCACGEEEFSGCVISTLSREGDPQAFGIAKRILH